MAKLTTPIPPDKIGESFVWRDWFQRLSDKVFGTMAQQDANSVSITGGSISNIDLNGNNISNARITNSFIESTPIGLNNPSAGSFTSVILGTPLAISYGGTNSTSTPTAGAVPYGTGTAYAFTAAGTAGQVLTSAGASVPTWTTPTTGTVTSVAATVPAFLSISGSPITTSGTLAISYSGTALPVANGGTGVTSLTAGYIPFGAGTSAFGSSANLFWDNTNARLGIGTSSPSVKLDVKTAIGTSAVINLTSGNNTTQTKFSIQQAGSVDWDVGITATDGHFLIGGLGGTVAEAYRITRTGAAIDFQTWNTGGSERLRLTSTGGVSFGATGTAYGTSGQVLTSAGNAPPTWTTPTTGTITAVSVVSANGFAGTSSGGATPALTLTTTITGLLKGNGTAISAAVANTDYIPLSTVLTKTSDYTITGTDTWIINNKPSTALTLTFPAASSWTGRYITVKNMQALAVNSATSNIVPIDSTTAGTAILLGVVGNWATLVSDGTNWVIMQAASNNNLLLE